MKKRSLLIGFILVFMFAFVGGVGAATKIEKIEATINHGISIILNGTKWTPKDVNGKDVQPILYKGSTFVPLRAVSEATGAFIEWNQEKQEITLITKDAPVTGEVLPFEMDTVKHIKWGYDINGITQNKEDLLFGEKQYKKAFIVNKVNSAGQGFGMSLKQGAKKAEVLIGFKDDKENEAIYTITDRSGQTLATGKVKSGTVEFNKIELPLGVSDLFVEFKGNAGGSGTGFLIWDESKIEF